MKRNFGPNYKVALGMIMSTVCSFAMQLDSRIYVAGHNGLVGSAIVRLLQQQGYTTIITRSSKELDLRNQQQVRDFFASQQPEYVFLAAAKVGGIKANMDYPAQFIYDNITMEANIIDAAYHAGVKKLLFLGSSCIYPRDCPQPIKEEYLLSGPLEPSNDSYALAKIAGIKMCQAYNKQYGTNFISCMPTNLYGPGDNFNLQNCHVLPALIAKIYAAQQTGKDFIPVWGTGRALREFLYVDDLAQACLFLMLNYDGSQLINVGTGQDISIADLAGVIKKVIGYQGNLVFDPSMPDGTPRKLLDVSKLTQLGWQAGTQLQDGIEKTVNWYVEHYGTVQPKKEIAREHIK